MLRVTVELLPLGNERGRRIIAEVEISNVGGDAERGDYDVTLSDGRRGAVRGFPRLKLGALELLRRALDSAIGDERDGGGRTMSKQMVTAEDMKRWEADIVEMPAEDDARVMWVGTLASAAEAVRTLLAALRTSEANRAEALERYRTRTAELDRAEARLREQGPSVCVAALVTNAAGEVLLIKGKRPGHEAPGGRMKTTDPTWQDAVNREVREETGLAITLDDGPPQILHGLPTPGAPFSSVIFIANARADGVPVAGDDATEAGWFAPSALPPLAPLASAEVVRAWAAEQAAPPQPLHHPCFLSDCDHIEDGPPSGDGPAGAALEGTLDGLRDAVGKLDPMWLDESDGFAAEENIEALRAGCDAYVDGHQKHPLPEDVLRVVASFEK